MTVEKGNLEYSFAFFYYNPHICELPPELNQGKENTQQSQVPLNQTGISMKNITTSMPVIPMVKPITVNMTSDRVF